jgi:hypothetical protein
MIVRPPRQSIPQGAACAARACRERLFYSEVTS